MKPIEILGANGEKVELYINVKPLVFRETIMLIPIRGLVDIFSLEVASQIANNDQSSVYLTEVNSLSSDLHGVKAFAVNLKKGIADYYEENRRERSTEEEYNLAKQELINSVSTLFEAKKRFARDILSRL